MAPDEVIRAVSTGNVIMPSGSINIGDEPRISAMNSVVGTINDLARSMSSASLRRPWTCSCHFPAS